MNWFLSFSNERMMTMKMDVERKHIKCIIQNHAVTWIYMFFLLSYSFLIGACYDVYKPKFKANKIKPKKNTYRKNVCFVFEFERQNNEKLSIMLDCAVLYVSMLSQWNSCATNLIWKYVEKFREREKKACNFHPISIADVRKQTVSLRSFRFPVELFLAAQFSFLFFFCIVLVCTRVYKYCSCVDSA